MKKLDVFGEGCPSERGRNEERNHLQAGEGRNKPAVSEGRAAGGALGALLGSGKGANQEPRSKTSRD